MDGWRSSCFHGDRIMIIITHSCRLIDGWTFVEEDSAQSERVDCLPLCYIIVIIITDCQYGHHNIECFR